MRRRLGPCASGEHTRLPPLSKKGIGAARGEPPGAARAPRQAARLHAARGRHTAPWGEVCSWGGRVPSHDCRQEAHRRDDRQVQASEALCATIRARRVVRGDGMGAVCGAIVQTNANVAAEQHKKGKWGTGEPRSAIDGLPRAFGCGCTGPIRTDHLADAEETKNEKNRRKIAGSAAGGQVPAAIRVVCFSKK